MADFIGLSFPFRKTPSELPASSSGADLIRESILQILGTNRGERVMRPNFGVNVLEHLFETNDPLLRAAIRTQVSNAITRAEPRVIVSDVEVTSDQSYVTVRITYIIKATRQMDSVAMQAQTGVGDS